MEEKKDFLGSLAAEIDKKPDSFREEKIERVAPRKTFSPKIVVGGIVAVAVVAAAIYFVFFAPNITMPDFVGKTKSDFSAWAQQYGIERSGVVLEEEYSMEFNTDVIMEQNIAAGEKIRKDAKITLKVSIGADPSEPVAFVDIMSMNYSELTKWIKDNKLINTKITTSYSDTVETDAVISYELKNIDEKDFVRGSALVINVSKGVKPIPTITVNADYVNQPYANLQSWAASNGLTLEMTEQYSSKIEKGNIVSLSVAKDDKIKQGTTIDVVVSKGPSIKMIYLDGYTEERVTDWCAAHGVTVRINKVYHDTIKEGIVTYQSIAKDTVIEEGAILYVGISKGMPILDSSELDTISSLKAKISDLNKDGAKLVLNDAYTYVLNDGVAAGNIVSISPQGSVKIGSTVSVVISKGKNIMLKNYEDAGVTLAWSDLIGNEKNYLESDLRNLCGANGEVTCKFSYVNDAGVDNGHIVKIERINSITNQVEAIPIVAGNYINQLSYINIVVCDKNS